MVGMTKTIARGYAAQGILCFRRRAGLHRLGNDRGISRRPRRGGRSSPTFRSGASRRTDEVAETIRWLAVDAPASATGSVIDVNGASYVR